ncbi:hypothetical protein [Mycobacterium sp. M23085]|uniref:hypothetical protein n=1 Tax=Mycobacterium sp. M23085 TaxID=3378087 RepID=UPI0038781CB0
MANRKSRAAVETVDRRPRVPGLYQRVLAIVCLREAQERRGGWLEVSADADALAAWEVAAADEADQLAAARAGAPIECRWYELPAGLPPPLDGLGRDPAPRYLTVYPDDVVDASEAFNAARSTYERARYFPNCDHAYFQAKFDLAREYGV